MCDDDGDDDTRTVVRGRKGISPGMLRAIERAERADRVSGRHGVAAAPVPPGAFRKVRRTLVTDALPSFDDAYAVEPAGTVRRGAVAASYGPPRGAPHRAVGPPTQRHGAPYAGYPGVSQAPPFHRGPIPPIAPSLAPMAMAARAAPSGPRVAAGFAPHVARPMTPTMRVSHGGRSSIAMAVVASVALAGMMLAVVMKLEPPRPVAVPLLTSPPAVVAPVAAAAAPRPRVAEGAPVEASPPRVASEPPRTTPSVAVAPPPAPPAPRPSSAAAEGAKVGVGAAPAPLGSRGVTHRAPRHAPDGDRATGKRGVRSKPGRSSGTVKPRTPSSAKDAPPVDRRAQAPAEPPAQAPGSRAGDAHDVLDRAKRETANSL